MIPYRNLHEVARRTLAALHNLSGKVESHRYLTAPNIGEDVKRLCGDNQALERPPFGEQVYLSLSRYLDDTVMSDGLVIYSEAVSHHPDDEPRRGRPCLRSYRTNPAKVDEIVAEIGDHSQLFPNE